MFPIVSILRSIAASLTSCMAVILATESLRAQSPGSSPEWFEQTRDNAWLLPYDTTLISRRAFAEFSYESHDDHEDFWEMENSLRGGYALGENLAFGLQLMVPVKWIDTVASDPSGLGDLELRSGFIGRASSALRWGVGLNIAFDPATGSALGGILNETDRHRLELGATRLLGADHQFAFSFSVEVPLTSETLDYKLVSGFAWSF